MKFACRPQAVRFGGLPSLLSILVLGAAHPSPCDAELFITGDITLVEEGGEIADGNFGTAGTAIAFDLLGGGSFAPTHTIENVNNGTFGNDSSWIGDTFNSWIGVAWDSPQTIRSFAFGRDNTGQFADRSQGLYIIEYTTSANVAADPASAVWTELGALDYGAGAGGTRYTQPALRHRFNLGQDLAATGFRLITPGEGISSGTAVDELEFYSIPGEEFEPPSPVTIVTEPGFAVSWDGNDGDIPFPGDPTVPDNAALAANGAAPVSSSDLGPALGLAFHRAVNINDGLYGNSNSWISGDGDAAPTAGVLLPFPHDITSIAWGRDNLGQFNDRSQGTYVIEITEDGSTWTPIAAVSFAPSIDQEPGLGFTSILRHEFAVSQEGGAPIRALGVRLLVPMAGLGGGTAIDELEVYGTGIPTLLTAVTSPANGASIEIGNPVNITASAATDVGTISKVEFFVDDVLIGEDSEAPYGITWDPPAPADYSIRSRATTSTAASVDSSPIVLTIIPEIPSIAITPEAGFTATWDGNDGDNFDPNGPELDGSRVPDNLALATNGATAFTSSDLGPELGIAHHIVDNINDGFYGNANSWISASADPLSPAAFAGIAFDGSVSISRIAWGRDNGNTTSDACEGGNCRDRSLGIYTVQITTSENPGLLTPEEEWITVATFEYLRSADQEPGGSFSAFLRHEYEIGTDGGGPVNATGLRILVPEGGLGAGTALDEIEAYGESFELPFVITEFSRDPVTGEITIAWNAKPGEIYALDATSDGVTWEELADGVTSPFIGEDFNVTEDTKTRLYRIRKL